MLVYDLADPTELQGFIRNIPLPLFTLSDFLPNAEIDDIEYRFTRGDFSDQDAAQYRGFDTEAPIGTRPGVSRVAGELPPISKKMRLGEEQRLRLRQLQRGGGEVAGLAETIFDDAANLSRSVQARIELARGQALWDGKVVINENGVSAQVDYGYAAGQRVAANTTGDLVFWDDPAADIIGDLSSWVEAYVTRTGGTLPAVFQTSGRVRGFMLKNTAVRTLAATLGGTPQLVTVDTLQAVLSAFDLPRVELYDTAVKIGGVNTRVIPNNRGLLLPARGSNVLGRTFYGTTAESLELVDARQVDAAQAPGLVAVNERTFDPVATWTKVAAIALPTIANPELVTTAQLLGAAT